MQINGVVERTAREGKALLVDGVWYGAYNLSQCNGATTGNNVSFNAFQKGKYWNIDGDVTVSSAGTASANSGSADDRQLMILRQNALTNAVNLFVGYRGEASMPEPLEVLRLAKTFASFTAGELDPDFEDLDTE